MRKVIVMMEDALLAPVQRNKKRDAGEGEEQ